MVLTLILEAIRSVLERRASVKHLEAMDLGISRSEISAAVRGEL